MTSIGEKNYWTLQSSIKITVFNYFEMELELLGLWKFAAIYVSMTHEQKKACEKRATEEANG